MLPELHLAYETWGTLNRDKSNAILLHTGLSASSHACSHEVEEKEEEEEEEEEERKKKGRRKKEKKRKEKKNSNEIDRRATPLLQTIARTHMLPPLSSLFSSLSLSLSLSLSPLFSLLSCLSFAFIAGKSRARVVGELYWARAGAGHEQVFRHLHQRAWRLLRVAGPSLVQARQHH